MKTSLNVISKKDAIKKAITFSIITLFFSMLIVGGVTRESIGASEEESVAKLIEGARLEGKMLLYTGQNIQDSMTYLKKFQEKYPFIKTEMYRASPVSLLNKILAEARAKTYKPDVLIMNDMNSAVLEKEGLYASYVSPESIAYQEGFKDPDGKWNSVSISPYLVGYNTKMLSRKDIPDTYEGFLNPRWKGKKIGFNKEQSMTQWFANILIIMGEEKGMDFFRKLVAQGLNYRMGHTLISQLIIAGEIPIGTVLLPEIEKNKKKGASVDWVGVSPVVTKLSNIGLAAHAPCPNAGKLFINFMLSIEGQMLVASLERLPARLDIKADGLKAFKGIKLYASHKTVGEKFDVYSKQFTKVIRGN